MTIAEIRASRSGADLTGVVDELCVVVPAHNEQGLVGNCLSTLHHARRELRRHAPQITCRVVVVADACHDRTAGISHELGATVIAAEHRNVGAARRDGVAAAIARSTSPLDRMWLASTDADCEVPSYWLVHFVAAAIRGYHMVTGMVSPTPGLSAAELDAWKRRHRYVDGHPHIHGANLGFRADAYVGLGGWSPLRTGRTSHSSSAQNGSRACASCAPRGCLCGPARVVSVVLRRGSRTICRHCEIATSAD